MRSTCPPVLCQMNLIFFPRQIKAGYWFLRKQWIPSSVKCIMPNSSLVRFCSQQSSFSMDESIFSTGLKQFSLCFSLEMTQGSIFFPITKFKEWHITEQTYFVTFLKFLGKSQLYFCNQAHKFFLNLFCFVSDYRTNSRWEIWGWTYLFGIPRAENATNILYNPCLLL